MAFINDTYLTLTGPYHHGGHKVPKPSIITFSHACRVGAGGNSVGQPVRDFCPPGNRGEKTMWANVLRGKTELPLRPGGGCGDNSARGKS